MIFVDQYKNCYTIDFRPTQSKYFCPICHQDRKKKTDRSLYINRNNLVGKCFNCEAVFFEQKESDNIVREYIRPKRLEPALGKPVIDYFAGRGISESTLNYLKVTSGEVFMPQVSEQRNCIKFNYYRGDELVNIKSRDKDKNFAFEKDCEVTFYNYNAVYNFQKIIIVEGEVDALSFVEAGLQNVVSLPNGCKNIKFLNQYIFDVERVKEWVLCLDKDEGGMQARSGLISKLGIEKCSIINTKDCKDANSYLVKYGKAQLFQAYNEAEKLIADDTLDASYIKEEARINQQTVTKPYKIIFGQTRIDSILEIITSGNISMLNGKSKSRKTYAVMVLLAMIMKRTENYYSAYDDGIVLFDTEQFKHHSLRFYNRLARMVDVAGFSMFNLRAYKKDVRLQFIKQYVEEHKPTLAIIDNVRDVIRNFNDIDQSDDVMTLLSNLTETTGTHILCTLHVNKGDDNARGHIGAELTQKAETVFMVKTEGDVTEIAPAFCRNEKFDKMQFVVENGLPVLLNVNEFVNTNNEEIPF